MPGLWFEEFREGMVIDHPIRRTVTESDNVLFCALTMNPAALHLDAEAMKASPFGERVVNSLYTLGLMVGISVHDTTLGTAVANLGFEEVAFPAPLFHGDTIRVRTTVLGVRESRSRPGEGIVTFLHEAMKQDGTVVARCRRAALMRKRPPQTLPA
ncbi:MAG: MaoC family dehydratase [Acetobacteraceae bacterium]|nr:MaoC family dehydratase [Acetobacteraceae bacterium]